ncbi:S41 family peptidase [Streptomyces sp. NPDC089919]|uniref:S41 family peptidase n=1 Tax=Streptomyces sp. NPDC089919 TaxID=3155188 RepID=UPI003445F9A4
MVKSTATTTAVAAATAAAALVLTAQPAPAATVPRPAVDGIWRTDGYGTVLAVRDGRLREYQTTAVSCLPGDTARRTGPGTYTAPDGSVLTLRPGADRTRATLSEDGSAGHRDLRRLAALPAACTRPAGTDPRTAFDVFWRSFEENYPFFAAKGVDWRQVRDRHRPTVHADTTKGELFAVFRAMVAPLHDAHVAVQDGDRVFAQGRPGTVMPSAELDAKVKKFVVARDLAQARNRRDFGNGRITYADLPGRLGYLRISGFGGYAAEGAPYAVQQAVLEDALDAILTRERTPHLRGLIIDLRVNGGGSDALGLRIARRLTDARYLAYAKRARNDPADPARHTRPQPVYVTPADGPRYTGPVAVLTGGSTVSAGETFTQALMGRPGGTVRIGQPTQGVFSDVMRRRLPGGLAAWLPNEEFLTRAGRTFDGPGIAPHLAEPVFTAREFAGNRDSAFDRAVQVLSRPLLAERAPAA